MLISYPILIARQANESEDAHLDRFLSTHVNTEEGRYPLSSVTTPGGLLHRWHGGVHLVGNGEPIRAIADGVVVAHRVAAARESYEGLGEYDTSFVLIRHETSTGAGTTVVFHSLYMHLASRAELAADRLARLPAWLRQAVPGPDVRTPTRQRVWRKDVLGFAGQLYGRETCHFEVFTTDAALTAFWHDSTAVQHGAGSADFFGDAHFVIPVGRDFRASHPRGDPQNRVKIQDPPGENHDVYYPFPAGRAGRNDARLFLSVRLERGRRVATTFEAGADGTYAQVGEPVTQSDYEYELFRLAKALYPDGGSAGFEWLRFGRVLGADTTARQENWQAVRYSASAIGYVDLAPEAIVKLSDADFVHWQGWEKRDEGDVAAAADGICDDARTIALCAATDAATRRKVQHLVCKAPSEWDAADLATRYARLREPGMPLQSDDSWRLFEEHVRRMAFWSASGIASRNVWHFHPLRFVCHYRKCAWFSADELAQCLPRRSLSANELSWSTALQRSTRHATHLNRYFLKYKGFARERIAHALAQIYIETGLLGAVTEGGSGAGHDYTAFYGRGYNQLTWAGNYKDYGEYKALPDLPPGGRYADPRITSTSMHFKDSSGTLMRWSPRYDPDVVGTDLAHGAEASGFFWVSKSFRGRKNMNRACDIEFGPLSVAFVSWLINGGGNGHPHRQQFAKYLANVLFDDATESGSVRFDYPALTPAGDPVLCRTFPPTSVAFTLHGTVHYDRQAP